MTYAYDSANNRYTYSGTTGAGATIVVTGGNTVMFVGCVFMYDENYVPDINITNNTKVKFVNCYGSVSCNAITA